MATEEFPKKELETLWAPWRVEYFEKEPRNLNFLSEAAQASDDAAHLVIARRKNAFLIMNRYPYRSVISWRCRIARSLSFRRLVTMR